MRLRWAARLALGTALLFVSGCSSTTAPNATPQITGLFPSEITAGSQGFTLYVSGSQFLSTSTVQWNGSNLPTTYNTESTQVAATIPAADLQNAGIAQVTVTSPPPGGGSSAAVSFTINPVHSGGPTITSISPTSAALNGPAFTLTVNGTNFTSSDYVTWNGGLRTTTYSSATQLTAQIMASDLTQEMLAGVAVHTSQLGVASPSVSFQVGTAPSGNVKFPQVISENALGGPANGLSSSPAISSDGRYVAFYSEAKNLTPGGTPGNIFLRDTCLGAQNCTPGTVAVDVAPDGSAPNAAAADQLAISADGRYVAFTSNATNLVGDTSGGAPQSRVFVRDLCLGSTAPENCSPHTELVSVNADGEAVGGAEPAVSADGRFISFATPALTGKPSSTSLVMVRDTCHGAAASGCTPQTILASVEAGTSIYVDPSAQAAISSSGRYVAFAGWAATYGGEKPTAPSQIFVRDTCLGLGASCTPSTARVSVSVDGQIGNADGESPSISSDGRFVAFESAASNLSDGPSNGAEIYLRDTCAGPTAPLGCQPATERISSAADVSNASGGSYSPAISPSGRYVSYIVGSGTQSAASTPSAQNAGYIVVYDTCFGATGACSPHAAELMASNSAGDASPLSGDMRVRVPVTNDGRFAAFFTRQALPALRASGFGDVFLTTTPFQGQR